MEPKRHFNGSIEDRNTGIFNDITVGRNFLRSFHNSGFGMGREKNDGDITVL